MRTHDDLPAGAGAPLASEHLIGPDLRAQAPVFVRGEGVEPIDGGDRR